VPPNAADCHFNIYDATSQRGIGCWWRTGPCSTAFRPLDAVGRVSGDGFPALLHSIRPQASIRQALVRIALGAPSARQAVDAQPAPMTVASRHGGDVRFMQPAQQSAADDFD
jgi:hypothetical protein